KRGKHILKSPVAGIVTMKLLVVALQETVRRQKLRVRLAGKGYMHGRGVGLVEQRNQPVRQRGSDLIVIDVAADQQPRTGGWRERHRGLQFWIIAPAGAFIGVRPAAVED